ncbi:MAG: hypothetical protein KF875_02840 [Trueperaceae bacterium]|nr:hypothetical protein [Trueperaceae bacterium]MCO5173045.1 hypothetical protein [Trueperaceae bacterium]MCW5820004.1 hypothetical protein [Trueperaceae bacterium]
MNVPLPAPFRIALPAYLVLLLVLAVMGASNQGLLRHQLDLMDRKEELSASVARARLVAGTVTAPQAVAAWARAAGFVPVPEGGIAVAAAAGSVDVPPVEGPSLEVRTVWR